MILWWCVGGGVFFGKYGNIVFLKQDRELNWIAEPAHYPKHFALRGLPKHLKHKTSTYVYFIIVRAAADCRVLNISFILFHPTSASKCLKEK